LTYNFVSKPCSRRDGLCYVTTSSALGRANMSMCVIPSSKLSLLTPLPAVLSIMSVLWIVSLLHWWI
jgi:hypothetical protein